MKYLVIGAGGTGGALAGYLAAGNKDVTLIARGLHLKAIQEKGLTILEGNNEKNIPVKALSEERYQEKADTIFVCVKYYSLKEIYSIIEHSCHENTIVIPVLNIFGSGEVMSSKLKSLQVLNGCIYIASQIESPGIISRSGEIFRVVFGRLDGKTDDKRLIQIEKDLDESGITPILSNNVRRDTLQKFSFVSPMAAAGTYLDGDAKLFKNDINARAIYIECVKEISNLGKAMDIELPENIVAINLKIMDDLDDDFTSSMQKDIKKGGNSEIDGLVFEVIRLGEKYNVELPTYNKIGSYLTTQSIL